MHSSSTLHAEIVKLANRAQAIASGVEGREYYDGSHAGVTYAYEILLHLSSMSMYIHVPPYALQKQKENLLKVLAYVEST